MTLMGYLITSFVIFTALTATANVKPSPNRATQIFAVCTTQVFAG
jgi:hypothetical protein